MDISNKESGRLKPVLGEQYGRLTGVVVMFLFILVGVIVMFMEGFAGALCLIPILVPFGYWVSSELNALDKMSKIEPFFCGVNLEPQRKSGEGGK